MFPIVLFVCAITWTINHATEDCSAFHDVTTKSFDVRIDVTKVPNDTLTTYVCQVIEVSVVMVSLSLYI